MSTAARIGFAVLALSVLAAVTWFSFNQDGAAAGFKAAAASDPDLPEAPAVGAPASAPTSRRLSDAEIPYNKLTTVARDENRVIYTTSAMGQPMEVHPDGLIVIHNFRRLIRHPDGREEETFTTIRVRLKGLTKVARIQDVDPEAGK